MTPGIVAITVFEHRLEVAIKEPGAESFAILAMLVILIIIAIAVIRRWLANTGKVHNSHDTG